MTQQSTDPTATGHLHAGPRITLDELVVQMSAVAVWLRQLAVAAETPEVPVELREVCQELDSAAATLAGRAGTLAKVDRIIADRVPLDRTFGGSESWGTAAVGAPLRPNRRRPDTVLTHWQILRLADLPDPDWPGIGRQTPPKDGIPYVDGIAGVPGVDTWESSRAAERRAIARHAAIQERAAQIPCPHCRVLDGPCKTRTDRIAETFHRPRLAEATRLVDHETEQP